MFAAFGKMMAVELVIYSAPLNLHSRLIPAAVVPNEVIVVVPVIVTCSPSADPMSVVEPDAMEDDA
jgi:hypothetical protein